MNYYGARQLASGGWHYTCRNDDRIWGVGYDGRYQTCPTCQGDSFGRIGASCGTCGTKGYVEVEPHPPHATADEARECATRYVLDTAHWEASSVDTTHSIPRCEFPDCTTAVEDGRGASWGFGGPDLTVLCPPHRNRESLAVIVGTVGEVISSS